MHLYEPELLVAFILEYLTEQCYIMVIFVVLHYSVDYGLYPLNYEVLQSVLLVEVGIHKLLHGLTRLFGIFTFLIELYLLAVHILDGVSKLLQSEVSVLYRSQSTRSDSRWFLWNRTSCTIHWTSIGGQSLISCLVCSWRSIIRLPLRLGAIGSIGVHSTLASGSNIIILSNHMVLYWRSWSIVCFLELSSQTIDFILLLFDLVFKADALLFFPIVSINFSQVFLQKYFMLLSQILELHLE